MPHIEAMLAYVKRHTRAGLFIEDPAFAGAERYSIAVTYWKDSELNHADRAEAVYPVIYTLAHFQNASALTQVGQWLNRPKIVKQGEQMLEAGLRQLWRGDHFLTAVDEKGEIDPPNSDSLHTLLYIPPGMLPAGYAQAVETYMEQLETPAGYRTGIPVVADRTDDYHTRTIWIHEQALLHAAAWQHGLSQPMEVANRYVGYTRPDRGGFYEILNADDNPFYRPDRRSNNPQYWVVRGYQYGRNPYATLLFYSPDSNGKIIETFVRPLVLGAN